MELGNNSWCNDILNVGWYYYCWVVGVMIETEIDRIMKRISKFFLFGRYAGVPFREYLSYREISNHR